MATPETEVDVTDLAIEHLDDLKFQILNGLVSVTNVFQYEGDIHKNVVFHLKKPDANRKIYADKLVRHICSSFVWTGRSDIFKCDHNFQVRQDSTEYLTPPVIQILLISHDAKSVTQPCEDGSCGNITCKPSES